VFRLVGAMRKFSKKYGKIEFPGYTHTRKAMPSSIALWTGAYIESMQDNVKILESVLELIDFSPLGTGAGYGVPLKIDRAYTAQLLGFKRVQGNPIYAQNSRGKFESSILHALSLVMLDLNKMATDLILFSMPEFGYFGLPKEFCTGSSIMPQKKNPDVLELIRAKYHVVVSYEIQVKGLAGNLISGYHRDLQLTKEPVMKGLDIVQKSLDITALVFSGLSVNKKHCSTAMTQEVYATNEVYKLVKNGVPFREAYRQVAQKF
ncbi:MAG: lyase family protein, partial [Patescibacteria group bacterium]